MTFKKIGCRVVWLQRWFENVQLDVNMCLLIAVFVISKRKRDFAQHQRTCGENELPSNLWGYRFNHDQHKLFGLWPGLQDRTEGKEQTSQI